MTNKKILMVVNDFSFFFTHRYPLVKKLSSRGFQFLIACNFDEDEFKATEANKEKNIQYSHISINRSSFGFLNNFSIIYRIHRLIKYFSPNILFLVSSKPNIFGGIAGYFYSNLKIIYSISGLGYSFINNDLRSLIARQFILTSYKFLLARKNTNTVFQNKDDLNLFINKSININAYCIIRGVGIDTEIFYPHKVKENIDEKIKVLFCSRLLIDKGINEFIHAAKLLQDNSNFTFTIAGNVDINNPKSISIKDKEILVKQNFIKVLDYIDHKKLPKFLNQFDVFVLPSYREGLPKIALEAAACGLPIIATDVTGCKDVVIENYNGYLVPLHNSQEIKNALLKFTHDKTLLEKYGLNSVKYVNSEFSLDLISKKFIELLHS